MKRLLIILLIFGIVSGTFWWLNTRQTPGISSFKTSDDNVVGLEILGPMTKKASFLIFTNGLRRDFSGSMYLHRSDDAYLGDELGVVTIIKPDTTWGEFFLTLPFSLTDKCLTTGLGQLYCDGDGGNLKFVLNEVETTHLLDQVIHDGDRLLVTFGNASEAELKNQMDQVPQPK